MIGRKGPSFGKKKFETKVPGKWVFAGEHSVLRGAWALSIPMPELELKLSFEPMEDVAFRIEPYDRETQKVLEMLLRSAVGDRRLPSGILKIESSIPQDAGFGSSAALCVAITQWLAPEIGLQPNMIFEFAKRLENHFHGQSSGMDVATVLFQKPVRFHKTEGVKTLSFSKFPKFTFHDTGFRAATEDCVEQVEEFVKSNKTFALQLDHQMGEAADLGEKGLVLFDQGKVKEAHELLMRGMQLAQECFEEWELIPETYSELEEKLKAEGALAVKLTGAGAGGFVVALWP